MQIAKHAIVSFDYTLTGPDGATLDTSKGRGPLVYMHGMRGLIPGLETELEGKLAGDELNVTIAPEKAYGPSNPQMITIVPRSSFPANAMILVGQQLQAKGPGGRPVNVRVTKISDTDVTVDGNHPLAGVPLTFDVKVIDVRAATEEEIAHGHAHGVGGHQH